MALSAPDGRQGTDLRKTLLPRLHLQNHCGFLPAAPPISLSNSRPDCRCSTALFLNAEEKPVIGSPISLDLVSETFDFSAFSNDRVIDLSLRSYFEVSPQGAIPERGFSGEFPFEDLPSLTRSESQRHSLAATLPKTPDPSSCFWGAQGEPDDAFFSLP